MDTKATIFENLLMHEYTECYLYYSMLNDESDENVKRVWEMLLEQEIAHLHSAVELLNKYENKSWEEVIPGGAFPELVSLHENKEYVRKVLAKTVTLTAKGEGYADVSELEEDYKFFKYQKKVNAKPEEERGHTVICDHIEKYGEDYRVQDSEHPIKCLRSRKEDNFVLGTKPTNC